MPTTTLYNEDILLHQMQAGSAQAFTDLYSHYSPGIYTAVLKMVRDETCAAEIVQDIFTKIWMKRESLGVDTNFSGYLFRMAQHKVVDHFRKLKSDRRLREEFIQLAGNNLLSNEKQADDQQTVSLLKKAVDRLSPQQKKVFELVRMEGFTYKKAAAVMGISPNTVKEYLVNTSKSIKSYLVAHSGDSNYFLWLINLYFMFF